MQNPLILIGVISNKYFVRRLINDLWQISQMNKFHYRLVTKKLQVKRPLDNITYLVFPSTVYKESGF